MTSPDRVDPFPELVQPASGRFVLRPYTADDAEALASAVTASVEHLRTYMPWAADEPISLDARRQIIAEWDRHRADGTSAILGIFRGDDVLGSTGLHRRRDGRPDILEIGYWVHVDHTRQGIALEAAQALTDAAFDMPGTSAVEILHHPANLVSRRIPERLGYRYQGDEEGRHDMLCVWRVTRDEWNDLSRR